MSRFLPLLFLSALFAFACPPVVDRCDIYLNKKGVTLKTVPAPWLEKVRKKLKVDEIVVSVQMGIPYIALLKKAEHRVRRITTTADLRPWFVEKSCLRNWERFNECMNERRNPADEALYHKLDRQFVARLICEEGSETPCDPDFAKWAFHWRAPAFMELEADIGEPGAFQSIEEAKKSLHKINALLKKVLYGAHFPETYGEGSSEYEIYAEESVTIFPKGFGTALAKLLRKLKGAGYLKGLEGRDVDTIEKLAKGGKTLFYLPAECDAAAAVPECAEALRFRTEFKGKSLCDEATKPGWHATSNGNHLRFDRRRCPHITILR